MLYEVITQIEAEALGCKLGWADDNPPAVISHPLKEGKTIQDLKVPCACAGRISMVMDATRKLREQHPDLALYGLITGPFTLALHLLGTDIFMNMMMDPDETHKLMRFCTDVRITSYNVCYTKLLRTLNIINITRNTVR